ncbi:hypothetical protein JVT61DRAFT_3606 [Boletus reticuloceps]|uniref:DUF6533 domain-containing protein n=1 Tax=Boletus reticuloceps TaxID=495285 RepID=A0A8I2YN84_9AGAM|nr:hypothetical protein JVT61DRAFT_3606 [Boletus reticuloceps]
MPVEYASEDIPINLSRLQFSKFLNVAAVAVFAFDYCLTFSSEIEYVWGTKWEVSRIVFTLSRYLPFISSSLTCYDALVNDRCGGFILALDAMYSASVIFAEGILILRTYALWGRSKRILFLLLFLAVAFIAGAEVTSLKFKIILPGDSTSSYQFYPSMCAYRSSRNAAFQYAFLVAYEIILQSMSSWRKFRTYRALRSRTLNTLYWDGIMYMWWIILLSGGNMAVMAAAPIPYIPALDTAQVAIHSVLASRIFFNLRECDKQIHSFTDEFSLDTLRYRAGSTVGATTQAEVVHVA